MLRLPDVVRVFFFLFAGLSQHAAFFAQEVRDCLQLSHTAPCSTTSARPAVNSPVRLPAMHTPLALRLI